jgi:hypothetical protein
MDLIFVHVPKCAGSALREALLAAYGASAVYLDNDDRLLDPGAPINVDRAAFLRDFQAQRAAILRGKRVAHGHFCLEKYHGIQGPRATILRDPVERLISHYFFWKTLPPNGHALHERFLAEKPTLVEFARLPGLRYFYTRVMFGGADMAAFDVIGATERMGKAIAAVEKLLGRRLRVEKSNENRSEAYREEKAEILANSRLMSDLRDLLAEDTAFYQRHAR